MNVKIVSYSRDDDQDMVGQVAYCARVSNPANQHNAKTAEGLIKYLIKEGHWSPFEMVSICLEIETTRDIARQILRHRSFSFQEFSQRYASPIENLDYEFREARLQDTKNRQNSIEVDDKRLQEEWNYRQKVIKDATEAAYMWALNNGIAKEQARVVLPEGNMKSRLYMNGTLRSWIHYIQLRTDSSTQKEHRKVALKCRSEIAKIFPLIEEIT